VLFDNLLQGFCPVLINKVLPVHCIRAEILVHRFLIIQNGLALKKWYGKLLTDAFISRS